MTGGAPASGTAFVAVLRERRHAGGRRSGVVSGRCAAWGASRWTATDRTGLREPAVLDLVLQKMLVGSGAQLREPVRAAAVAIFPTSWFPDFSLSFPCELNRRTAD